KVGLLIIVAGFVIGEWVAPITEQKAQTMRSVAQSSHLSLKGSQGLWAKDGTQYINVRAVLPGRRLNDIYIYEVDHQHHVTHIMYAASAYYRDENWILEDVKHSYIVKGNVVADHKEEHVWNTTLRPELLSVVTVKPNTLSIWGLYQYVQYLEANGLSAEKYKQSLWTKATLPVVTVLMVLLSIPFVFGPMRSVSIGTRVLVGTLVGIGFHLVSQMFAYMGLVFELNTAFSALLPTLLAMLIVVLMLRRVH
ncbi:MAG: LPS export ABC transporter permease LptG, partial [Gammaproteobacteria bacterium]